MERNAIIKAIWGTSKQLGLTPEELHATLFRETGRESMRDATDTELQRLLAALKLYGGVAEAGRGRLTYKQKSFIEALEALLGWKGEPERLRGFIRKTQKVERLEWLTPKQASNLIDALKAMLAREKAKATAAEGGGVNG